MESYVIFDKEIVVKEDGSLLAFEDLETIKGSVAISEYFEEKSMGIRVLGITAKENLPEKYKTIMLREFFAIHSEEENFKAFRAKALLEWRFNTKFCGRCGGKLEEHSSLTARQCPSCGNLIFPRIEPCIIVLITKGDKILLARHAQRNQDIYACIAGFMEAGESAEHAVRREVLEETGLTVKNIQYKGSQSWPFPSQLMLGFTAEYESGDINLQKEEISDAQWFDRDGCPAMPKPGSIAYRLIHNLF